MYFSWNILGSFETRKISNGPEIWGVVMGMDFIIVRYSNNSVLVLAGCGVARSEVGIVGDTGAEFIVRRFFGGKFNVGF